MNLDRIQEWFNKVWQHAIVEKNPPSVEGYCLYRGPKGAKCFVGVLIPDDKYKPTFDRGIGMLSEVASEVFGEISSSEIRFLSDIRFVHDEHSAEKDINTYLSNVRIDLTKIAFRYALEIPDNV